MTARRYVALWLIALFLVTTGEAVHGQDAIAPAEPSWAVEIAPGSACANDAMFRERLSAAIPDRQRAPLEQAGLRARVAVARDQTASLAVFDRLTQQEAGQRKIALPRGGCTEAAEALALVIAVMVEAGRSLPSTAPEPGPEPAPPPPPEPQPEPEKPEAAPPTPEGPGYKRPARYAWQGPPAGHDLDLQAGAGVGLLPQYALGGNLGWGIRGSRVWPVWITATGWLTRSSEDLRARIGAAYATLSICPLYLKKYSIRGRLCPGFGAGAVWASGRRLPTRTQNVSLLTLASLSAAAHVRLYGPLELVIEARMEVPLPRLKFTYERVGDGATPSIHEMAVITGSFFGGLGLRFR